jgi:hypothetical protein
MKIKRGEIEGRLMKFKEFIDAQISIVQRAMGNIIL